MVGIRVIVCGGRDFSDKERVWRGMSYFEEQFGSIEILAHGAASGADSLAAEWARLDPSISQRPYPASWRKYGKRAGPMRNQRMLAEVKPDYVIAFEGGKGTADMCRRAEEAGIKIVRL